MSGVIGVREIGINGSLDRTFNCFVCGKARSDLEFSVFVEPREEGEKIVTLFDNVVKNCAWLDFRPYDTQYIQVKIIACEEHESNLKKLREIILDTPKVETTCVFDPSKTHSKRFLSEFLINQARV